MEKEQNELENETNVEQTEMSEVIVRQKEVDGIYFTQQLEDDDIIQYNYYIFSQRKSMSINSKIIGVLALGLGVFTIIKDAKTWIYATLLIVLGLFSIFCIVPMMKIIVKNKVRKSKQKMKPINVEVDSRGLYYYFEDESLVSNTGETITPFEWGMITKVLKKDNRFFIHINTYTILVIKQQDDAVMQQLATVFQDKLQLNGRYFVKS